MPRLLVRMLERLRGRGELRLLLLLIAAALLVRAVYYVELSSNPFFPYAIVDSDTYDKMAVEIAAGRDPFPGQPFFQPPLYPYFLGLTYSLFGRSLPLVRSIQLLIGVFNVLLMVLLARRLLSPRGALAAGAVLALYGTMLFFEGELLAPVLIVFLNLLLLLAVARFFEAPSLRRAFLSGLLLGGSALAMAVVLPFAAVLVVYAFIRLRGQRRAPALYALALCFLLGLALVLAPVTLRNLTEGDDLVLVSSNAGINLYVGTGADFDKKVGIRPGYEWQALSAEPVKAGYGKPSESSAYFTRKAWTLIRSHPLGYARTLLYKLYLFAHGNEIMRNQEIYPFRQYSWLLAVLVWKWVIAFPYGILFPLAAIGAFVSIVERRQESYPLLLFTVSHVLVIVLFFVSARYRINILPFLIILAVTAVSGLVGRCRDRKGLGVARLLAPLCVLLVVSNWRVGEMPRSFNADAYYNLGVKYMEDGRPGATELFRKALELDPDYPEANGNLGARLFRQGDLSGALSCFQKVLERYPDDEKANINVGVVLQRQGHVEDARAYFRKVLAINPQNASARRRLQALERHRPSRQPVPPDGLIEELLAQLALNPEDPQLLNNLGTAYVMSGRYEEGLEALRRAVTLAPTSVEAYTNLAIALIRLDRREEARLALERLVQLDPDNVSARRSLERLGEP